MSMKQRTTLVGVFDERTMAERAVDELLSAGFRQDQISFSGHGTASGGILDHLKRLFTGEETSAADSAADFMGMGIPQQEAVYYEQEYQAGRSLVAVQCGDRFQEAMSILSRNGGRMMNIQEMGYNTASTGTTATTGMSTTDMSMSGATTANTAYADTTYAGQTTDMGNDLDETGRKIRLREERLMANKERVQAGEVGIHKEVVSEEKTLNVPVTREEVYIERRPVSKEVPGDFDFNEEGEEIRVPVTEEQVEVTKRPVVREELNIGKRVVQENQQVSDTVRKERLRVDRQGDVNVNGWDETVDRDDDLA